MVRDPFVWAAGTGVLVGISLGMVTRFRMYAQKRWTVSLLLLSAAIGVALAGSFVCGPQNVVDPRLAWMAGGAAVVFGFGTRFPRLAGSAFLLAAVALSVFLFVSLDSWDPYTPGEPVLTFNVVASVESEEVDSQQSSRRLEVERNDRLETIVVDELVFSVELLEASPYWLIGAHHFRLVAPALDDSPADSPVPLAQLPGWEQRHVSTVVDDIRPLYEYRLKIAGTGELLIELVPPS